LRNSDDPIRARRITPPAAAPSIISRCYLWSEGIGVKWTTGAVTRESQFYDLIWVDPAVETVVGLLWCGYPAEIPQTPRKALNEILVELP